MRVLFITTPYPLDEFPIPSLSLTYPAAMLMREGVEVEILDLLVAQYSPEKIRGKLEEYQPQVVGTSCATMNYPAASRILKVCKSFDPGIVTIIGGPHVSFTARETLMRAPWIDIVVCREGEETSVELIKAFENEKSLKGVSGIAFRENGGVVITQPRPPIEDLGDLPFPARHLLPISKYRALGTPASVITSRGCPFGCIFCSAPKMFGRRVRFRSPRLVVDEIETIHKEFGFERINIVDDTLTVNRRHVKEICGEIMGRSLDIEWSAYSRVDTITEELLQMMKEAGCRWLCFGIESGSQEILNNIRKGITIEEARRAVRLATEAGINVMASFILGLPGETPETAQKTADLANELLRDYGARYGFHLLAPMPGTEVYERADELGIRLLTRNWARYSANEPVAESYTMSAEEIMGIKAKYDEAVASAWQGMRSQVEAGDPRYKREVEERASQEFVWRLLKGDVIERLGLIEALDPDDPVEQLAQRVSKRLAVPLDMAQEELESLVKRGLLRCESAKGGFVWGWS